MGLKGSGWGQGEGRSPSVLAAAAASGTHVGELDVKKGDAESRQRTDLNNEEGRLADGLSVIGFLSVHGRVALRFSCR